MLTPEGGRSAPGFKGGNPSPGPIQVGGQTFTPQQYLPPTTTAAPSQAPQPTYFNPNWQQSQAAGPPVNQAPSAASTLAQPSAPVATGMNAGPMGAPVGNMGGGLASQESNSQLWQGAPNYESQLYANMYSGNPGGIPSSIPNQQLLSGNPAAGIGASGMPSYLNGNLSGSTTPDINTLNIGQNQSALAGINMTPRNMSYLRGAGG